MHYLLDVYDKKAQIIRMAHTDVAGLGHVLHRYMGSERTADFKVALLDALRKVYTVYAGANFEWANAG